MRAHCFKCRGPVIAGHMFCPLCHFMGQLKSLTDRTTDPLQTEPLRQGSQSQGLTGAPRDGAEGDSKPSR